MFHYLLVYACVCAWGSHLCNHRCKGAASAIVISDQLWMQWLGCLHGDQAWGTNNRFVCDGKLWSLPLFMHACRQRLYIHEYTALFVSYFPDFKQQYHMHLFDYVCHILHLSHTSHICQIHVFAHISQISQICQLFHINLFVQISQTCLFVCFFRFVYSYLFLRSVSWDKFVQICLSTEAFLSSVNVASRLHARRCTPATGLSACSCCTWCGRCVSVGLRLLWFLLGPADVTMPTDQLTNRPPNQQTNQPTNHQWSFDLHLPWFASVCLLVCCAQLAFLVESICFMLRRFVGCFPFWHVCILLLLYLCSSKVRACVHGVALPASFVECFLRSGFAKVYWCNVNLYSLAYLFVHICLFIFAS